jgi:hypothetical protein
MVSSSTALEDIGRLNNKAASLLVESNLKEASHILEVAIRNLRTELDQPDHLGTRREARSPHADIRGVPIHPGLCRHEYQFSPNNACLIYNNAFVLPTANLDRDVAAVTVLFNFGLVMQRRGILEGRDSWLRKSLKIYAMALSLAQDEALECRKDKDIQLLALAIWANQGFIYSHMLDYAMVNLCKEEIRDSLTKSPDRLSVQDKVFFFQAVFYIDFCGLSGLLSPAA